MLRLFLFLFGLLLLPLTSEANEYCQEKNLVLDKEQLWNFSSGFATELNLPTHRGDELVPSMGKILLGAGLDPTLWAFVENSGEGSLGIEYMVYKLEIRIGEALEADHQVFVEDYSRDCSEPGLSIGYGRRYALPPIKILPHANGEPRGLERVRIRVWGWQ